MRRHEFAYIRPYYIYILCVLYIYTKVFIILVFASGMLKGFFEFIMFFCERILTLNMLIVKMAVCDCFIPFPKFVYISLYIIIYIPGIFILNIKVFIFNKKKSKKTFKNILQKVSGETNYFFSCAFFIA